MDGEQMEILNDMTEYGFMEGAYLRSRILEPYSEIRVDENGKQFTATVSVAEQARALSKEWKPVDPIDEAQMVSDDENYIIVPHPYDAGDHIGYKYNRIRDIQRTRAEIQALKDSLAASDYKVAKCYEASLTGADMPYDIDSLIQERQAARKRINALQEQIE